MTCTCSSNTKAPCASPRHPHGHQLMRAGMRLMDRLPKSRSMRTYLLIKEMGEVLFDAGFKEIEVRTPQDHIWPPNAPRVLKG